MNELMQFGVVAFLAGFVLMTLIKGPDPHGKLSSRFVDVIGLLAAGLLVVGLCATYAAFMWAMAKWAIRLLTEA